VKYTVSTVNKSVARMPLASAARNCRHDGDCGEQGRDRVGKDAPDRARRDANAEASKPALDADTAPAPVLSGEPDDELDELVGHGRPTRATRGSPAPPFAPRCQRSERLWRDEEGAPAPSRQQPGEGGEDRPIHRAVGDAHIELALEDGHLVAEHHDLDVLVRLGPQRGSEQAKDPAQAEVTEGEGHGRSWSLVANTASSGQRSRFWCPTPHRSCRDLRFRVAGAVPRHTRTGMVGPVVDDEYANECPELSR
jgi:hypothetical protein